MTKGHILLFHANSQFVFIIKRNYTVACRYIFFFMINMSKRFYQPFPLSGLSFIAYCNMRSKALMKKMMTMFTNNG